MAAAGPHDRGHGRNVSKRTHGGPVTSCNDIEVTFDHRAAVTAEETRTIPYAVGTLHASPLRNGGIEVAEWDRNEYSVTLCKAADPDEREQLGKISLTVQGGRISVQGPDSDERDWTAYLIVRAPKDAALDLEAHNGPLGFHGVSGRVRARTVNGPLSFTNCGGDIEGETQNGPINIEGGRGQVRLRAQNGPLNVELSGSRWEGGSLEGSTQNGPLNLSVPANFQSGVRVDASRHSPVECRASQCRGAVRTWDYPNRISFGSGDPVVRLSTVNGPVNVE